MACGLTVQDIVSKSEDIIEIQLPKPNLLSAEEQVEHVAHKMVNPTVKLLQEMYYAKPTLSPVK